MPRGRAVARPRALHEGATIGVCAPAGPVQVEQLDARLAALEQQGFRVCCSPHLRERSGYLSAPDDERLQDLLALFRDPSIDAILAARGGFGLTRILDRIDAAELAATRKLFMGYSDATALQLLLLREGLASLHGPMLERDDVSPAAWERWRALVRGEPGGQAPMKGESLRAGRGRAEGRLVGGNLKLLTASLGTSWEVCTEGAILFLEEIGEQPYAIDRSLQQLRETGKLAAVAGVAIGALVDCASPRYPEVSACDVIQQVLLPAFDGPVVAGLPFGHIADHQALGVGVRAALDGNDATLALLEPVVDVEGFAGSERPGGVS